MKYFNEDEKNQVCCGAFKKQKISVFEFTEKMGAKYLESVNLHFICCGTSAKDVTKQELTDYLKNIVTTESTGIPFFILWWIAPYIIRYIVDKLLERYFNEEGN